jgi:hypothetical protein
MSNFWKSFREFGRNPTKIQTQSTKSDPPPVTADCQNNLPDLSCYPQEPFVCSDNVADHNGAAVDKENNPDEIKLKLPTAECIEQLIGSLDATVSSNKDIKLLVNVVLSKETTIFAQLTTIANLQSELANMSHNREGQLEQLIWLNSVVADNEDIIERQGKVINLLRESRDIADSHNFEMDVQNAALEVSLSNKSVLCEEQSSSWQQ